MSCPRAAGWPALVAHRFDSRGQEPEGLPAALEHLDGCPECRRAALAADPTLVFRRLAVPAAGGAELPPADIAEMQRAVAAMRTASRIAGATARPSRSARLAAGRRWASAAMLVLAAGSTGNGWRELPGASQEQVAGLVAGRASERVPVVDEINLPSARVYEFADSEFPFAMVYDETLDDL